MPKKSSTSSRSESTQPLYKPRTIKQHHWGGDGTVGIPDSIRTILRYQQVVTATTTLGAIYSQVFRGNSAYDPDYSGAGAQPAYYDNYANMYNSFVVLSSRVKIDIINTAATSPVLVALFPAYNTSIPTTALDAAANRYAVATTVMGTGNATKGSLTSSQSTAQMFGVPPAAVLMDDQYSGSAGNPAAAQSWYWTLCAQNETGTTTLALTMRVTIDYDIKFFDPVVVNLSATRTMATPGVGCSPSPALTSSSLKRLQSEGEPECSSAAAAACSETSTLTRPSSSGDSADAAGASASDEAKVIFGLQDLLWRLHRVSSQHPTL